MSRKLLPDQDWVCHLQVLAQKQLEVCKPPLVKFTSNLLLKDFTIPSGGRGVGSIPHNVLSKMEKTKDLLEIFGWIRLHMPKS